jgi:hypothetical protein
MRRARGAGSAVAAAGAPSGLGSEVEEKGRARVRDLLTPGFVAKRVRYLTDLQLDGAHRRLAKSDGHRANE